MSGSPGGMLPNGVWGLEGGELGPSASRAVLSKARLRSLGAHGSTHFSLQRTGCASLILFSLTLFFLASFFPLPHFLGLLRHCCLILFRCMTRKPSGLLSSCCTSSSPTGPVSSSQHAATVLQRGTGCFIGRCLSFLWDARFQM